MATVKVSALTEKTSPSGSEELLINDGGTSKKITIGNAFTDTNTTYTSSDFTHDDLSGFVSNEHIDWTTDQGATNIHSGNYTDTNTTYTSSDFTHDSLSGVTANEHIDWTGASAGTIHSSNYTDTNTMGSGFTVSATTDTTPTTITQGDDLMFTAGTGITCETTADGTVTITNTVSGASTATSSATGVIKIEDDTDQSVAANTVSATAGRTYGIQLNSSDQAVVNVPWTDTDTNTTYSVQDGELSENNFTDADHTKLNGIESNATADQTKSDIEGLGIAASSITGALPAISGASLTSLNASNLGSGTVPGARLSGITVARTNVTTEGQVQANTFVTADGSGYVNFGDNEKIRMGAGNDLQIYHDGSNSYIKDTGTGNLIIRAENLIVEDADGTNYFVSNANAETKIYHNGSQKFVTTASGVEVTGTVQSSSGVFQLDTNDKIDINGSNIGFHLDGAEDMRLENDGDLHVDGDVLAYSTTVSDERLKTGIMPITNALSKVNQLNGCTFTYTTDGKESAGLIAQDVEKVLPSAISESTLPLKQDDGKEYKVLQYDQTIGLLVEAIKELTAKVEELESK